MDDDDYPVKSRPEKKQTRVGDAAWKIKQFSVLKKYVIRTTESFVIKEDLAYILKIPEVIVGSLLRQLVNAGVLTRLQRVNPVEKIRFQGSYAEWEPSPNGGKWVYSPGLSVSRLTLGIGPSKGRASKREIEKWRKKHPSRPVSWAGKAYFIIRNNQFRELAKQLGLPGDPEAPWYCPRCGASNPHDSLWCSKRDCDGNICTFGRISLLEYPPPPKPVKHCWRCGIPLHRGLKFHPRDVCNELIVSSVMEP